MDFKRWINSVRRIEYIGASDCTASYGNGAPQDDSRTRLGVYDPYTRERLGRSVRYQHPMLHYQL
jgi:hypothetical protein